MTSNTFSKKDQDFANAMATKLRLNREQLKQIISFTRGPSAWEELLRTEADIRKKRQKMIYDQEERRRKLLEAIAIGLLVIVIVGFVGFIGYLFLESRGIISPAWK